MNYKLIYLIFIFLAGMFIAQNCLAIQFKFSVDIPGVTEPATDIGEYIARIYQLSLGLASMLALGMIIWGGIEYTIAAGNVARQADARDRITQALLGLILLFGAYLILNTIDPGLTNLAAPKLDMLKPPALTIHPEWPEWQQKVVQKRLEEYGEQYRGMAEMGGGFKEYRWSDEYKCPEGWRSVPPIWCENNPELVGSPRKEFCCARGLIEEEEFKPSITCRVDADCPRGTVCHIPPGETIGECIEVMRRYRPPWWRFWEHDWWPFKRR